MVDDILPATPLFKIVDYEADNETHVDAVNKLRHEYMDFGQHPFIDSDAEFRNRESLRFQRGNLYRRRIVLLGGEVVATGSCNQVDTVEGIDVRYCTPIVKSTHTRRGIGTALLKSLAEHPPATAKHSVIKLASYDLAGEAFAKKHGFQQTDVYIESVVVRHSEEARRAFLRAQSAVQRSGLQVEISSIGPLIEESDIADVMELYTCAFIEGRNNRTPRISRAVSYQEYCDHYKIAWMYGEEHYWSVARDIKGEPVGLAIWNWRPAEPTSSMGIIIGVRPSARGHGLADLLRAAVFERIQTIHPSVSRFRTQSVNNNNNMLRLNSRSGYSEQRSIRAFERQI